MTLKTNLKNKIQVLFGKKESLNFLGVCLRQSSLGYVMVSPDKKNICNQVTVAEAQYLNALTAEEGIEGQTHLILSAQQTQIVQIDKPSVPAEEMLSALKWQIKDVVNVAPENMLLDYYDGPKLSGGVEKINVVCAPLSEIKPLAEGLLQHPFTLQSITTEEFSFAQLLPVSEHATLVVCQQPNEEIVLIIVKQGRIFFHRRLRGFSHIAQKSEEELSVGLIDNLSLEIQRSTDYFERQLKQASIKSIEVIVPIALESFMARKLSENTNVEVNLLNMPSGFENYRHCAAAVGAIMPHLMPQPIQDVEPSIGTMDVAENE